MCDWLMVIGTSTAPKLGMFYMRCENPYAGDRRTKLLNPGGFHLASMANSRSEELGDFPYVEIQARSLSGFHPDRAPVRSLESGVRSLKQSGLRPRFYGFVSGWLGGWLE